MHENFIISQASRHEKVGEKVARIFKLNGRLRTCLSKHKSYNSSHHIGAKAKIKKIAKITAHRSLARNLRI